MGEKRPAAYDEIGFREMKYSGTFDSNPTASAIEIVKADARAVGGDVVILVSSSPTHDVVDFPGGPMHMKATYYRFVIGKTIPTSTTATAR